MANNRIFYATQAVALSSQNTDGSSVSSWYYPRGLQSVGITTNFGLEQAFQLGQIEIYDNIENVPEVEVTMSKVIDGTFPLYLLCMGGGSANGASGQELASLANNRVNFRLGIYSDTLSAATGTPGSYVTCSGMYLSSVTYTIPVEGNATEDVTLVGNNKIWNSGIISAPSNKGAFGSNTTGGTMTAPALARRYKYNPTSSVIPTGGGGGIPVAGGRPILQNITISTNLGREAIYELGRMDPYHRYVTFPVEVTSELQINASSGDEVECNDFSSYTRDCDTSYKNLQDKSIKVVVCGTGGSDALSIDLGSKNKLTSVNYSGGDTGGGVATVTYSYQTFNKFVVTGAGTFISTAYVDNTDDAGITGD